MILLACSKRSEIIAAPEPSVTPCTHMCRGVCTVGACPPFQLAHLAGAPMQIAVNATHVVVRTISGVDVVDKKTQVPRRLPASTCEDDRGLAVDEAEAFFVGCGSEVIAIHLATEKTRVVTLLKTRVFSERMIATRGRVGWLGGGSLEVVTTSGAPVRIVPTDVVDAHLVGETIYWSQSDESIWKAHGSEAPERIVQGYDARGAFAATEAGVFWPNRHDRTLVRLVAPDKWPQWLGYDPRAKGAVQAVADREWLYYRDFEGITKIGHAHWSEPTPIAGDAHDMATDGTSLFYITEHDGTSLMVIEP